MTLYHHTGKDFTVLFSIKEIGSTHDRGLKHNQSAMPNYDGTPISGSKLAQSGKDVKRRQVENNGEWKMRLHR